MITEDFIQLKKITQINNNIYETLYNTFVSKNKFHFKNDKVEFDYRILCEYHEHSNTQDNHTEIKYWIKLVVDYDSIHQAHKEKYNDNTNNNTYNVENGNYYNCRVFHMADFLLKQKIKNYYGKKEQENYITNKNIIIQDTFNKMLEKLPQVEPKIKNQGATKYQNINYILFNQ